MLERIEGIIIKTHDYQESNKIVTIFSKKLGKFSALARGAKKPKSRMAALTQPFIHGEFFVYVNSGLSTIQQGDIIDSFRPIREDIIKTAYASYMTELIDKLLDQQSPDPYIYEQFHLTMKWLSEKNEIEIPIMMYELKLFRKAGFAPVVDRCVHCHNKSNNYAFSISEGGLLCNYCQQIDKHSTILPQAVAKFFNLFLNVGLERIGTISIAKENILLLRQILDNYYDKYGSYALKTRNFLKQLDLLQ